MPKANNNIRAILIHPNGRIFDITGIVTYIGGQDTYTIHNTDEQGVPIPTKQLELQISNAVLEDLSPTEWYERLRAIRTASEWKCDYCGRPNPRKQQVCLACGGSRSFLYG